MMHDLYVNNVFVSSQNKEILHGISCRFPLGDVTVLLGPNGSGKSTLARAIMGDSRLVVRGSIECDGKDISLLSTHQRARTGIFLSLQSPFAIPGVTVVELLKTAYASRQVQKKGKKVLHNPALYRVSPSEVFDSAKIIKEIKKEARTLSIREELLRRSIHEGFSGGERKKIELLQALILKPKLSIFDEIDTGLDVDALNVVAQGIKRLQKEHIGIVLITHNMRILQYIHFANVVIMKNGNVAAQGGKELIEDIEEHGYEAY